MFTKGSKLIRQKCEFIFEGPLDGVEQKKQVRHLLLWVRDKGLDIYNTTTWTNADDKDKTKEVLDALENYTKPQSNQILSRYQLRCLKQGDMPLEELVTKVHLLVDDSGYQEAVKQETLKDTLVFGLRPDKVQRKTIAKGNALTFQQVYEFAKVDESTRLQMKANTQHEDTSELHAVRSRKKPSFFKKPQQELEQKNTDSKSDKKAFKKPFKFKSKVCFRCGGNHDRSVECPAKFAKCKFCGTQGHFLKVCLKRNHQRVHQIDKTSETDGAINNDVFLGTLASEKNLVPETLPLTVHSVSSYYHQYYSLCAFNGCTLSC